jgi:hypothetical protein
MRGAYCWYILVGLAVLRAGRAAKAVALWATGRNALMTEVIFCNLNGWYLSALGMKWSEVKN